MPFSGSFEDTNLVTTMPWHHKDPFDRLLVAQAIAEGIPILSVDGDSSTPTACRGSGKAMSTATQPCEDIKRPSRLAEEAMVATVVAPLGTATGPDQLGDKTTPMGENPSRHQAQEGLEAWRGENALELG